MALEMADNAEQALPAFGYFGSDPLVRLHVPIGRTVDKVRFSLRQPHLGIINVGAIDFLTKAGSVSRDDLVASVSLSSIYGDKTEAQVWETFRRGGVLHTAKESDPWIEIVLKQPTFLESLAISNRGDEWGIRSLPLQVAAGNAEALEAVWDNLGEEPRAAAYLDLATRAASLSHFSLDTLLGSDQPDQALRAALAEAVLSGAAHRVFDWRAALWTLPIYDREAELDDHGLAILAYYVLRAAGDSRNVNTGALSGFSRLLRTRALINALLSTLNRIAPIYLADAPQFVASKHSINPSVLASHRDEFLALTREVMGHVEEVGAQPLLCYGSLLGAVRTGEFIPHDDDVDILYIDDSATQEEAFASSERMVAAFAARGFSHWRPPGSLNFNVNRRGRAVDLFPCWRQGDKLFLMMERFQIRPAPFDLFLPPSSVTLHGHAFPAPAQPEAFLEERYGPGWRRSDPFHEWPWKLAE